MTRHPYQQPPEPTVIGRRRTADGKALLIWSDGVITWGMGWTIRGVGKSRSADGQRLDLAAAWLFADEACLYDSHEVATAVRAARYAVRQPGHALTTFRQRMHPRAAAVR